MSKIKGVCASKGYCCGKAVVKTDTAPYPVKGLVLDYADEIAKFRSAQRIYSSRLETLAEMAARTLGGDSAGIFRAYQVIALDEAFFKNAFARIEKESIGIEFAVDLECKKIAAMFDSMDDDYMRERAMDIKNVCNELIHIMMGVDSDFSYKTRGLKDVVLVAENLTPAEVVKIDKSVLRGIVTEYGSLTSHIVIIAKIYGIPAIVGAKSVTRAVRDGDFLMLDGFSGEIEVNPDEESHAVFDAVKQLYDSKRKLYSLAEKASAVTRDGFGVTVGANVWSYESARMLDVARCDGVGHFHTETMFLNGNACPSEEDQFRLYTIAVQQAKGREAVFCTLAMDRGREPVLGETAPVLSPEHFPGRRKGLFGEQLRAILRASASGPVKIMFPMIASLEELLYAKECLAREKRALKEAGHAFFENPPVGILIDTPAAVLLSDILAGECDFFRVGSNLLIQNITAAGHAGTGEPCDYCSAAVLRAVHTVAKSAARAGIPWGVCGAAADDEPLIPLWLAMGAEALSVPLTQVGSVKHMICGMAREDMRKELDAVLKMGKTADIRAHMNRVYEILT